MSLDFSLVGVPKEPITLFSTNMTHNCTHMASVAGIYECLWRPEEHGYKTAGQIIDKLRSGIAAMKREPAAFRAVEAPNGWGTYDQFLPWVEQVLEACEANPEATLHASR